MMTRSPLRSVQFPDLLTSQVIHCVFIFVLTGPNRTGVNGPMPAHVRTAQLEHRGDEYDETK